MTTGKEAMSITHLKRDFDLEVAAESTGFAGRVSRFVKQSVPFFTSLCIHVGILLLLAASVFPESIAGVTLELLFSMEASNAESSEVQLEALSFAPQEETMSLDISASPTETIDVISNVSLDSSHLKPESIPKLDPSEIGPSNEVKKLSSKPTRLTDQKKSLTDLMPAKNKYSQKNTGSLATEPKEGIKEASDVKGAVKGLFETLESKASNYGTEGELWIVWLLDSSVSLSKERERLSPLIHEFYTKLDKEKHGNNSLKSGVFAFGSACVPVFADNGFLKPQMMKNAVSSIPIDPTGIENVNSAILSVLQAVPFRYKQRIEVVVWTDESGNDLQYLEEVIFLCRQRNAHIHVIGPLSVLGMQKGLQQADLPAPWNDKVVLPVDRGPDSYFPERARLPIWHGSTSVRWGDESVVLARDALDGGPHSQLLLAPAGPYGLSRLALATGGTFTILTREGDKSNTLGKRLADYLPDYRSPLEIAYDIDRYPLRRAIIASTAITNSHICWPRECAFPFKFSEDFPYKKTSGVYYMPPATFQSNIEKTIPLEFRKSIKDRLTVEQALQVLVLNHQWTLESPASSSIGESMEDLESPKMLESQKKLESLNYSEPIAYQKESSLRWRAWYDLNLGRLLAHSVRLHEYGLACEKAMTNAFRQEMLMSEVNALDFVPSEQLLGGEEHNYRSTLALELLKRVEMQHPNTPWARLAALERSVPMGFSLKSGVIPPPQPVGVIVAPRPPLPRPPLPNL